jgi:signal transduction histidine kinase
MTSEQHKQVIGDLPVDLKNYATAVLVQEAARRNAIPLLLRDKATTRKEWEKTKDSRGRRTLLHPGIDEAYLRDTGKHVDHDSYRVLERRMKELMGDKDPQMIREVSRGISELSGLIGFIVVTLRRNAENVIRDSEGLNRKLNFGQAVRVGKKVEGTVPMHHFIFNNHPYLTQTEGGVGYIEGVPGFWTPGRVMQVDEKHSQFSLTKLLADSDDYGYLGWQFREVSNTDNTNGTKFIIEEHGGAVAESVTVAETLGIPEDNVFDFYYNIFVTAKHGAEDLNVFRKEMGENFEVYMKRKIGQSNPFLMLTDVSANGRVIFPEGRVYGMPTTFYKPHIPRLKFREWLGALISGMRYESKAAAHVEEASETTRTLTSDLGVQGQALDEIKGRLFRVARTLHHELGSDGAILVTELGEALTSQQQADKLLKKVLDASGIADNPSAVQLITDYLEGPNKSAQEGLEISLGIAQRFTELQGAVNVGQHQGEGVTEERQHTNLAALVEGAAKQQVRLAEITAIRYNREAGEANTDTHIPVPTLQFSYAGDFSDYEQSYVAARLQLMVTNMVKNALEAQATNIEISLDRRRNYTCLVISDNGTGMDNKGIGDYLAKKKSGSDGTSMGNGHLIIHEALEAHGGKIKSIEQYEKGLKFTMHIPHDGA